MATRSTPRRAKKSQTRLAFQPLPSSSPAVQSYSEAVHGRLASVRVQGRSATSRSPARASRTQEPCALPTPEASSQQDPPDELDSPIKEDEEDEEEEIVIPSSKRRRLENININSSQPTPSRQSSRLKAVRNPAPTSSAVSYATQHDLSDIASAETSSDDEPVLQTQPPPSTRRRKASQDDDDPFIAHRHTQPRPVRRDRQRAQPPKEADFVVDDDEIEYISSDDDAEPMPKKKPSKKKGHRSRQQQNELDDDLANLQDSDVEDATSRARTRGGPVTTQKDRDREHFDLLRRRRSAPRNSRKVVVADEEDEEAEHDNASDGVDIDQIADEPNLRRVMRHNLNSELSEHEHSIELEPISREDTVDEEDFIVDDDVQEESRIDRPHPDMPLEFTSFATRKPKDLFVYVVEWLVKNKIAPAFSRSDELYNLSWTKLNDQIKAQAGSRLISSAWNEEFKNTILARPQMNVMRIDDGDDEAFLNCDACNRSNHPARYQFQFEGHAYNKETLEPVDGLDDESEDSNNDDAVSYDQAGHALSSQETFFYLGSHCAANAEMGHKLTHWKFHLNSSLLDYLEEQGVLSADSILAREKLNKKKRERQAENIVDDMQATGIVQDMWRGLQDDLEDARFGMEDHYTTGGRSKARIGKVRVNRGGGLIEEWGENGRKTTTIVSESEGD